MVGNRHAGTDCCWLVDNETRVQWWELINVFGDIPTTVSYDLSGAALCLVK